jgi:hypothetical protein
MEKNAQREAALALLAKTGIWPSNYAPPLFHLLWRLGMNVPPPHFIRFVSVVIFMGALFGGLMSLLVLPMLWSTTGMSGTQVLIMGVLTGLMFGLAMAGYYAYGRSKHRLPSWDALGRG